LAAVSFIDRRRWVWALGVAILLAVSSQGIIGKMRVDNNLPHGTLLRVVHGCSAPIVLAMMVAFVLVTSRLWCTASRTISVDRRVRIAGSVLAGAVYLQVVFGAILRHTDYSPIAQRMHLLLALAVVALATWLVVSVRSAGASEPGLKMLLRCMEVLLALQLLLGVETWLKRFREGLLPGMHTQVTYGEIAMRTAHHLTGLMLFATTVAIVVWLYRSAMESAQPGVSGRPEVAA
jgi:cytochrome c oxidase assembly protein subunit 15